MGQYKSLTRVIFVEANRDIECTTKDFAVVNMNTNEKGIIEFEVLACLIVVITFIMSLAFPLILKYVGAYAAPTAVYANRVLSRGMLLSSWDVIKPPHSYWKGAIEYEVQYPAPSLLLSILMLISNIPLEYAMFVPIAGIANIIYFVLAKHILTSHKNIKSYGLLFAALYYAFVTSNYIGSTYAGRASLGITLFTYFLFCCSKFLHVDATKRSRVCVIVLVLLALVSGYTYYTTSASIITIMLPMITLTAWPGIHISLKRKRILYSGLSVMILTVFLFINNPIITRIVGTMNGRSYIANIIQYLGYMLGKIGIKIPGLNTQATVWDIELIQVDLISCLGERIVFAIQYSSIVAVIIGLLMYEPRNRHRSFYDIIWLFCLSILLSSFGELGYFAVGPKPPLRLLMMYGPIVTLFILGDFISKYINFKRRKEQVIALLLIILAMSLGCWGSLRYAWRYGWYSGKPFAYHEVHSLSEFLSTYSESENPVTLTGDAYYTANILFITSLHDKVNAVIPEPLGRDAISLYECLVTKKKQDFFARMDIRNIKYLLLVDNTRPIHGDSWGYVVDLPKASTLDITLFTLIYSDGRSLLYMHVSV